MSFMGVRNGASLELHCCWRVGQAEPTVSCSGARCPHEWPTLKFTFRGTCGETTRNEVHGEGQPPPRLGRSAQEHTSTESSHTSQHTYGHTRVNSIFPGVSSHHMHVPWWTSLSPRPQPVCRPAGLLGMVP